MSMLIAEADATVDAPAGSRPRDHPRLRRAPPRASCPGVLGLPGARGRCRRWDRDEPSDDARRPRGSTARRSSPEPAAGVVREDVVGRDMVTTFRVQERGNHAFVTIRTTWTPPRRAHGFLERQLAPDAARRLPPGAGRSSGLRPRARRLRSARGHGAGAARRRRLTQARHHATARPGGAGRRRVVEQEPGRLPASSRGGSPASTESSHSRSSGWSIR